jgi:hypothetical protein
LPRVCLSIYRYSKSFTHYSMRPHAPPSPGRHPVVSPSTSTTSDGESHFAPPRSQSQLSLMKHCGSAPSGIVGDAGACGACGCVDRFSVAGKWALHSRCTLPRRAARPCLPCIGYHCRLSALASMQYIAIPPWLALTSRPAQSGSMRGTAPHCSCHKLLQTGPVLVASTQQQHLQYLQQYSSDRCA